MNSSFVGSFNGYLLALTNHVLQILDFRMSLYCECCILMRRRNKQCVPKLWHIKFRCLGIAQKKEY